MYHKYITVLVGAILLTCSSAHAAPKSWNELTNHFFALVSSHRTLKPNLQHNIETFFSRYIDSEQLLHVETHGRSSDSILDFLAFNCYGILKRVVPRDRPDREEFIRLAVEHLFHEALLRLGRLNDSDLSRVIQASLDGKYNIMMTLTCNRHLGARDRLMYFLIDRSSNTFASTELTKLCRQAIGARDITCAMERERAELSLPLVECWEELEHIGHYADQAIERHQRENFLTQVINIASLL